MVNGGRIRELREAEQLSVLELANKVGASQAMISFVERGLKQPGIVLLKRIADCFGVSIESLLTGEKAG